MVELSLAYLFAAALIGGLVLLARRNQRQGWRKERRSWFEVRSATAVQAFGRTEVESAPSGPLQHLADLARLQEALSAGSETNRPEAAPAAKQEQLVRSR